MYIRRKVYSAVEDENGEIRYFSTNEIISEEEYLENLYSEDYLDDDDMERLFAEKDYDKGLSKGAKIAIGAGSAAAAATALHFGGRHAAKKAAKGFEMNLAERGLKKVNDAEKWMWDKTGGKLVAKGAAKKEAARAAKAGMNNFDKSSLANLKEESLQEMVKAGVISEKEAKAALKAKAAAAAKAEKAAAAERKKANETMKRELKKRQAEREKRKALQEAGKYNPVEIGKSAKKGIPITSDYAAMRRVAERGFSDYED